MENNLSTDDCMYNIIRAYEQKQSTEAILNLYKQLNDKSALSKYNNKNFIHLAAEYADSEAIAFLIGEGVRANDKNGYGQTALHYLAIESLRNLRKMNMNESDIDLRIQKCAEVLLNARVSVLFKDNGGAGGDTCYHAAVRAHNLPFIEALLNHNAKLDMTSQDGKNILHLIIHHPILTIQGQLKYARQKEEIDYNEQVLEDWFQLTKKLIAYGIDPEVKDCNQATATKYATDFGFKKFAVLLAGEYDEADPSINDKIDAGGKTLHQAAYDGDIKAVEALIKLGADVNDVNTEEYGKFEGQTPLAIACYRLNIDCIEILLQAKADPNFRDGTKGRSAFYYMVTQMSIRQIDLQRGNSIKQALDTLLRGGFNPDSYTDQEERSAINLVCSDVYCREAHCKRAIKEELLNMGIGDYNSTDINGKTPLMGAASENWYEPENTIIQLIEGGAELAKKDRLGNTALMYAALNTNKPFAVTIADLLLSLGNPLLDAVNNDGKTALDLAVDNDNENLVKLLLSKQ